MVRAVKDSKFVTLLQENGMIRSRLAAMIAAEIPVWAKAVEIAGMKIQQQGISRLLRSRSAAGEGVRSIESANALTSTLSHGRGSSPPALQQRLSKPAR
jgi:hypothetical protein